MAVNYTNLFTLLGKILKAANYYESLYATMKTNRDAIYTQLSANSIQGVGDGLTGAVSTHISGLASGISYFQQKMTQILLNQTLVLDQLPVTDSNINNVLSAMYADMKTNTQHIKESFTGVGTIVKGTANATAGDLVTANRLDGVSPPTLNGVVMPVYGDDSTRSQLGVVDTVYCRCLSADTEGQETFQLFGNSEVQPYQENTESVGGASSLNAGDAINILSNPQFETFATGVFTGWTFTMDSGALSQETSIKFRGSSAAKVSTIVTADDVVSFKQAVNNLLTRRKMYQVGVRIRTVANEAGGNVVCSARLQTAAGAVLATSTNAGITVPITSNAVWSHYTDFILLPNSANLADVTLDLFFAPDVANVDGLIFDDAYLIPVTYFNGIGFSVINGAARFQAGDLFTVPITRATPGVFQEGFRKTFRVQMPSSGSPSQADALAT